MIGKFDRNNQALATLKDRYPLTKESSTKQTWHVTLDLKGTDLDFSPGDSVGIYAQNDPILVDHLIEAMQAKAEDLILHKRSNQKMTLHHFLTHHANLSRITSSFLKLIHECSGSSETKQKIDYLMQDHSTLRTFLAERDPLNLLRDFAENKLPLQEVCDQFGPLLPRFYSIASSKKIHQETLDLTVALFTWMQGDEKRYGVASHFLCHLAEIGKTPIPIFVQAAHHFRLPQNPHIDIIMVGPGTGIAPFRAFMQERYFYGSQGRHWLFFGERHRESDFFYEEDWKQHSNLRLHTAFSRDQEEKVYVQHLMLENAQEIYQWLQEGAHLYICGDAKEMAKDVEKTLQHIIATHSDMNEEQAKVYLKSLKKEGRYLLDVY